MWCKSILIKDKYTYLGITLNEFLDFNITAKAVAQSASHALGLLIAKYKCIGGMTYDVYSKLYDTLVWPVISYGASVWGTKSFSCINAVQNRAMRVFLPWYRQIYTHDRCVWAYGLGACLCKTMDINYTINLRTFSSDVQENLMNMHILEWQTQINRESRRSGIGRNKLRTYKLHVFKIDCGWRLL